MKKTIDKIRIHKKWFSNTSIKSSIDPNTISALSVLFSVIASFFIFHNNFLAALSIVVIVLALDFLDGAISRGNTNRAMDQYADWVADRLSEFLLFLPLIFINNLVILLLVANILLTLAANRGYLVVLPLRHFLFIWLIYRIIA